MKKLHSSFLHERPNSLLIMAHNTRGHFLQLYPPQNLDSSDINLNIDKLHLFPLMYKA